MNSKSKAVALHLIEKNKEIENLKRLKPNIWSTGYWKVSDKTANSLINGRIYLHRGQKFPPHISGIILSYEKDGDRKIFRFREDASVNENIDFFKWGNEKGIEWENEVNSVHIQNEDEESSFAEGRKAYKLHNIRERDAKFATKAKNKRLKEKKYLACDVCDFDFSTTFGSLGNGYIEAHHTIPISQLNGKIKTKLSDFALVCSNCHRMLHRSKPMLSIQKLREIIHLQTSKAQ